MWCVTPGVKSISYAHIFSFSFFSPPPRHCWISWIGLQTFRMCVCSERKYAFLRRIKAPIYLLQVLIYFPKQRFSLLLSASTVKPNRYLRGKRTLVWQANRNIRYIMFWLISQHLFCALFAPLAPSDADNSVLSKVFVSFFLTSKRGCYFCSAVRNPKDTSLTPFMLTNFSHKVPLCAERVCGFTHYYKFVFAGQFFFLRSAWLRLI